MTRKRAWPMPVLEKSNFLSTYFKKKKKAIHFIWGISKLCQKIQSHLYNRALQKRLVALGAGKRVSHNCCIFLFLQPQIHCGSRPELLPQGCPGTAPPALPLVGHTPSPIPRCLADSVILVSISSSVMISNKNLCCPIDFQGGDRC